MQRFELTMMCSACKWKITNELKKRGYQDFEIDMNTSILTFNEPVNPDIIINIVNNIGYKIEAIEEKKDYTDEELALIEDAIRNGYNN